MAAARAALCDANHLLYLVKANQLFVTGHGGGVEEGLAAIRARLLLVASADDLVFPPPRHMRALRDRLAALGRTVAYSEAISRRGAVIAARPSSAPRPCPVAKSWFALTK